MGIVKAIKFGYECVLEIFFKASRNRKFYFTRAQENLEKIKNGDPDKVRVNVLIGRIKSDLRLAKKKFSDLGMTEEEMNSYVKNRNIAKGKQWWADALTHADISMGLRAQKLFDSIAENPDDYGITKARLDELRVLSTKQEALQAYNMYVANKDQRGLRKAETLLSQIGMTTEDLLAEVHCQNDSLETLAKAGFLPVQTSERIAANSSVH